MSSNHDQGVKLHFPYKSLQGYFVVCETLTTQNALKRDRCDSTDVLTSNWQYVLLLNLKWKEKPIKVLLVVQSMVAAVCRARCAKWRAVHERESLL